MAADLLTTAKSVLKRLGEVVAQDAELRLRLGELVRAVLALAEEPGATVASDVAAAAPPAAPIEAEPSSLAPPPSSARPAVPPAQPVLPPLAPPVAEATEAPAEVERSAAVPMGFWQPVGDEELPDMEQRCLLKAQAAQWAVQRLRLLRDGADYHDAVAPRDNELIARAKALPECFLWMIHRDGPAPKEPQQYESVSNGFHVAAVAIRLLRDVLAADENGDVFFNALQLAAEAQCAVRSAVAAVGARPDLDQNRLFQWLRATASARQLVIPRFMRANDVSEPASWPGLRERIAQAAEELERAQERVRRRGKLLGKVKYYARQIAAASQLDHADDWRRIFEVTAELLAEGLPPSNRELRELLLPVIETLPDTVAPPDDFRLVLREIDRYLALRPAEAHSAADGVEGAALSGEVRRVADLLRGRAVVLIGGQRRPHAANALTAALELGELIWLEGSHSSYFAFEPHVARPDVAVVLLAVRWSAHGFAEVKAFCDKYAKPLVRLPAGYNANQVAYHILGQVGERLAASPLPR